MKTKSINSSVVISLEDVKKIKEYIKHFQTKTGFKISIAEFVKTAIREKLKANNKFIEKEILGDEYDK